MDLCIVVCLYLKHKNFVSITLTSEFGLSLQRDGLDGGYVTAALRVDSVQVDPVAHAGGESTHLEVGGCSVRRYVVTDLVMRKIPSF